MEATLELTVPLHPQVSQDTENGELREPIVLKLPAGSMPVGVNDDRYLAIGVVDGRWSALVRGLAWPCRWELIQRVCETYAADVALGTLKALDKGRWIKTPEQMIRYWRSAIASATPIADARSVWVHPHVWFEFRPSLLGLAKCSWRDQPGLAVLLDRYGIQSVEGVVDLARLAVDLTRESAPADAWWIGQYLRSLPGSGYRIDPLNNPQWPGVDRSFNLINKELS